MKLAIYTDGAASKNGSADAKAGWGWIALEDGEKVAEGSGGIPQGTNNQAEMTAIIKALEWAQKEIGEDSLITIYSDSQYCINGITSWIKGWKSKGWKTASGKPVKNKELWIEMYDLAEFMELEWQWVRGHNANEWNEKVDKLAVQARLWED